MGRNKKEIVKKLGQITVKECHINKIVAVIKHIPGHGLAKVDSHKLTPIVKTKYKKLKEKKLMNLRISFLQ